MELSVSFVRSGPLKVSAPGTEFPPEISRAGGQPPVLVAPGNIVAVFGSSVVDQTVYVINGVQIDLEPYRNYGHVYTATLTDEEITTLLGSVAEPPPPPLPPFPPEVGIDSNRTPFDLANRLRSKMRERFQAYRGGRKDAMTPAQVQRYYMLRSNRNTLRSWRRGGRATLRMKIMESLAATRAWVESWDDFLTWYDSQEPTEEQFSARNGGIDIDSQGREERDGYVATWDWRQRFDSDVRAHRRLRDRIADSLADAKDRLGLYDESDQSQDLVNNVVTEALAAGVELGLTPHDVWNERNDGAVWFTNEEDQAFFFSLLALSRGSFDLLDELAPRDYPTLFPHADLGRTAIQGSSVVPSKDLGKVTILAAGDGFTRIRHYFDDLADEDYPGENNPFAAA